MSVFYREIVSLVTTWLRPYILSSPLLIYIVANPPLSNTVNLEQLNSLQRMSETECWSFHEMFREI